VVGGSATFRRFIKEELMPGVRSRYRTTDETAIVGESLAGLFIVETFFLDPDLFNSYLAFDPSLWWNNESLVKSANTHLAVPRAGRKSVYLASSNEPTLARVTAQLAASFEAHSSPVIEFHYAPMPAESHATIYHPAALQAFRTVFAPPAAAK
jgi:predicted alpha/beta superfamily hydrolase